MTKAIQAPSLILPTTYAAGTATLAATETINDIALHTSVEFEVDELREKSVHILAAEVVLAGVPPNLWVWVELSPYPTANNVQWPAPYPASANYWGAIGGGGGPSYAAGVGAMAPVAPLIIAGLGVNAVVHNEMINWNIHSKYARVIVQAQAIVATAVWAVQVLFSGKY